MADWQLSQTAIRHSSMNRGYAFGFLLVILVVVLGFYVALTGFQSGREAWRAQATPVRSTEVALATPRGTIPVTQAPTMVVTATLTLTATTEVTATVTATGPSVIASTLTPELGATDEAPDPTQPPIPTPTLQPAPTSTPQMQPPTPMPNPGFQFRLGGPTGADANHPCCYIFGSVRNADGIGIPGIRVQVTNEWATQPIWAETKGGAEAGLYDIPLGYDAITWQVMIVDPGGNQISTKVEVPFDPNAAGGYRVDWQRTY